MKNCTTVAKSITANVAGMNKFGIIGHIVQVYPHGSTDTLPFATMGSGSLAAMAVFESRYKEDLTVCCHYLPQLPRGLKVYACVL